MFDCSFSGNSDMLGLGIRIGFYLQWYGTILAGWIARSEVPGMRMSNSMFVSATLLGLVVQTAKNTLHAAEIYIVLLLCFGEYVYYVPAYTWKFIIWILKSDSEVWDPSRYPRVGTGPIFSMLNFGLLIAVSVFELWFWLGRVRTIEFKDCVEYGFLFTKVRLNIVWFLAVNTVFQFLLLFICIEELCATVLQIRKGTWLKTPPAFLLSQPPPRSKVVKLQKIQSGITILVASAVLISTELTIRWNKIQDIDSISTAGQLIPTIISFGQIARVLYLYRFGDLDEDFRDLKHRPMRSGQQISVRLGDERIRVSIESMEDGTH